jgi:hypothetical protein
MTPDRRLRQIARLWEHDAWYQPAVIVERTEAGLAQAHQQPLIRAA